MMSESFITYQRPKHLIVLIFVKYTVSIHISCVIYGQRMSNSSWKLLDLLYKMQEPSIAYKYTEQQGGAWWLS